MKLWRHFLDFLPLTKPRVTLLAVFCAFIGMLLSLPVLPTQSQWQIIALASLGIWLLSAAAFAVNCIVEVKIDAKMKRTAWREAIQSNIPLHQTLLFASLLFTMGGYILYFKINPLTFYLTAATFLGYAFIYTLILKPLTPQNIVIGGLSGAMPPLLGWAAMQNQVSAEAWLLVLIIFCWTPPHFWALCLYRQKDYEASPLPMLPVTHGQKMTCFHSFLYALILGAVCFLPYLYGSSGLLYLFTSLILNALFIQKTWSLYKNYDDSLARSIFKFSISYLSILFLALLLDHYFFIHF
jgi:heme o synthase